MQNIVNLIYLSLAVSAMAMTITKAKIFSQVRGWVAYRSEKLGDLLKCPYCMSHWLAFGIVIVYQPVLVSSGFLPIDLFVSAMVIVAIASFISGLIYRSLAQIRKFYDDEEDN